MIKIVLLSLDRWHDELEAQRWLHFFTTDVLKFFQCHEMLTYWSNVQATLGEPHSWISYWNVSGLFNSNTADQGCISQKHCNLKYIIVPMKPEFRLTMLLGKAAQTRLLNLCKSEIRLGLRPRSVIVLSVYLYIYWHHSFQNLAKTMWTPLSINVTAGSLTNAMANRKSDNIPVNKET